MIHIPCKKMNAQRLYLHAFIFYIHNIIHLSDLGTSFLRKKSQMESP